MDKITIKGMEFFGKHGVLPEEKSLGQQFIVDVEIYKSLQEAGSTDTLDKTVNYADVFQLVKDMVRGPALNLIETLAEKIADMILKRYEVNQVLVRVKKPQAPIPGTFAYVSVEIVRRPK